MCLNAKRRETTRYSDDFKYYIGRLLMFFHVFLGMNNSKLILFSTGSICLFCFVIVLKLFLIVSVLHLDSFAKA